MASNVAQQLAALAMPAQTARLLQLQGLDAPLVVERFSAEEAVCGENRIQLHCLATDAFLDIDPWLGKPLTLQLRQADGAMRQWHGLCSWAAQLGSDGGLARYELHITPWTCLLDLRRNALIFQDLDVRGVCEQVFADYPQADFRFDVTQALPSRAITTQYRETDWAFVTRLLAEAGLAWRFDHVQGGTAAHTLVIFDPAAERSALSGVRFHRADGVEPGDAITRFSEHFEATPNASTVSSWHTEQLRAVSAQRSQSAENALPALEVYAQPRAGRFARSDDADASAQARLDAWRLPSHYFSGAGSERRLAAGNTFTLSQHDLHAGQSFQLLRVQHAGVNNLGSGVAALRHADDPSTADALENGSYRNRFVAVTADTPVRALPRDRPTVHGPMTALVVGLPEAAVSSSRDHQVRIQFGWQRGTRPNAGGSSDTGGKGAGHAPGDLGSGFWVPVVEWIAGPNWGTHFLPRIGAEVLVEFLHGDIDQPRIVGQLYNGTVAPPFGGGVDEAAAHPGVLSGLHTQSHDGSGTQQWVIDDSTGQLRTRLQTSLGDSRLELGYLVQHQDTRRGAYRGEGFELATQGWGNVHAGQGLLLSTTARARAGSTQLDNHEAVAQIKGAERSLQSMSELLVQQKVPGLTKHEYTRQLREQIDPEEQGRHAGSVGGQSAMKPDQGREPGDKPVEAFAKPLLLAESPHHLAWTTPATAAAFAGRNLQFTAQQDLQVSAGETLSTVSGKHVSLFAQQGPLKAVAAKGPLTLHAHTGELEILADQNVTFTASDDRVDIIAQQKIVLQAGNCSITLEGGDITIKAPGEFTVKSSEHPFLGAGSGSFKLSLPDGLVQLNPQRMLDFSG